jgi:hypothetical protein
VTWENNGSRTQYSLYPTEFLIPVAKAELSNPNLIGSPVVTHEEYNAPRNSKRKKNEDVQELSSTSEETSSYSPGGGGGDKVDKKEKEDLQAKFEEERAQAKKEKEQLLTEQWGVKEAVNRSLHFVTGLEPKAED